MPWSLYAVLGCAGFYTSQLAQVFICGDYRAEPCNGPIAITWVKWPSVLEGHRTFANWGDHLITIHKKGCRRECTYYQGISCQSLPGKVYTKCLEERCLEIMEPKLEERIPRAVFVVVVALQGQILTLLQIWEIIGVCQRRLPIIPREKHWGVLRDQPTLLTAACYWPLNHCIPAQKFTSASAEINRNCSQWVLDSSKLVQCHHSCSYSIWIR